jgi:hypothetical protein
MRTRQDYITAIGNLVGGELPLGEAEKIFAINKAVKTYSGYKPRIVIEDEAGDGGFDYALTLLLDWIDGFSAIKTVEYPVDDTVSEAQILDSDEWAIYEKPAGKYLRFLTEEPLATESMRIDYTSLQTCTDESCTIPAIDEEAVQMLAASVFCDMLATYYAQTQDSTIQADSVDHKSKASEYAAKARVYRANYYSHIGLKEGDVLPAGATKGQKSTGSWGTEKATHGRRIR